MILLKFTTPLFYYHVFASIFLLFHIGELFDQLCQVLFQSHQIYTNVKCHTFDRHFRNKEIKFLRKRNVRITQKCIQFHIGIFSSRA